MKIKFFFLLLSALFYFNNLCLAERVNTLQQASTLYSEGKYEEAKDLYEKLLLQYPENEALHYNMGNCYFKLQQLSYAIYHFEKAIKIKPNYEDAQHNLQLANMQTIDKMQEIPDFFIKKWITGFLMLYHHNTWAITGIFLLFGSIVFFLFFLFSNIIVIRKVGFYSCLLFIVAGLLLQGVSYARYNTLSNKQYAIIKNTKSNILSAPADDSKKLFVLHEGSKILKVKEENGWLFISLPNGNKGWIKKEWVLEI
ncbi:MAG: tetratricopeptide repeat protein [Flavobacteriales bacterium]|nr:tetratricopeptide repeat protein [Flavobacteriales bacterium]